MVATGATINSGQGTGDLSIAATVGDTVRAFAVSGSNNFEDCVLLYGMPSINDTDVVFGEFDYQNYTKSTVVPDSNTQPLPASTADQTFWFFEADVTASGTESYAVQFGLYTRNDAGAPELYGYFKWDPTITVAG